MLKYYWKYDCKKPSTTNFVAEKYTFMPNTSALISQWPKSAACYICGTRQRFAHKINRGTSRLAAIHTQKHNCIKISPNRQRSHWIGQERRHFFIRAAKICNLFWLSQKKQKKRLATVYLSMWLAVSSSHISIIVACHTQCDTEAYI